MTNLFRYGGPYEIAITSYGSTLADLPIQFGSTLADLPIRFARQFGATFNATDTLIGAVIGGLVLYYLVERFGKTSPRKIMRMIPFVGKKYL